MASVTAPSMAPVVTLSSSKNLANSLLDVDKWETLFERNSSCLKGILIQNQYSQLSQYRAFTLNHDLGSGPEFTMEDKTDARVIQINNDFQQSTIDQGISSNDIEAILNEALVPNSKQEKQGNQGKFGWRSESNEKQQGKASSKYKKLQILYRHPKLRVYLDERYLKLDIRCQTDLKTLKDSNKATLASKFLEEYGNVFPTQIVLGGHVYHSQAVSTVKGNTIEEKEYNLKIAAAATLPFNSTTLSWINKSSSKSEHRSRVCSEGTFWSGIGGDPRLHRDPAAWESSLEDLNGWQIIERTRLMPLPRIINKIEGWDWVEETFNSLLSGPPRNLPPPPQVNYEHFTEHSSFTATIIGTLLYDDSNDVDGFNYSKHVAHRTLVFFQDCKNWIRYGSVGSNERDDILVLEPVVQARERSPLVAPDHKTIVYVDKQGKLCDHVLCNESFSWDIGNLSDLQLDVAHSSNLAVNSALNWVYFLCFEQPDGNIGFLSRSKSEGTSWKVTQLVQDEDLHLLPGTSFYISTFESPKGWFTTTSISIMVYYQSRDGSVVQLEFEPLEDKVKLLRRSEALNLPQWIPRISGTRNRFLLHTRGISSPSREDKQPDTIIFPDINNEIILYSGHPNTRGAMIRNHPNVCTIREGSQFVIMGTDYLYMIFVSPEGRIELTQFGGEGMEDPQQRQVFGPNCRRRRDYGLMLDTSLGRGPLQFSETACDCDCDCDYHHDSTRNNRARVQNF